MEFFTCGGKHCSTRAELFSSTREKFHYHTCKVMTILYYFFLTWFHEKNVLISTINTKSSMLTWFRFTFVDVDFTLVSSESELAFTMKIVD